MHVILYHRANPWRRHWRETWNDSVLSPPPKIMKHPRFGICQICAKYSFSSFHSCLRAGRQQILRRGSFWTFIFASWLPSHIALRYHFFKECSVPAQKRALLQETTCLRVGLLSIPLSRCRLCLFPYLSLSLFPFCLSVYLAIQCIYVHD